MKKKKIFAITGIIAVSFSLLGCHKSTSTSSNEGGNGLEKFIEKQKENDTNINTDTSKDIDTDTSDSGESSFGNIDANTMYLSLIVQNLQGMYHTKHLKYMIILILNRRMGVPIVLVLMKMGRFMWNLGELSILMKVVQKIAKMEPGDL